MGDRICRPAVPRVRWRGRVDIDMVNVFVPTTPNPTSGFLLFCPRDEVIFMEMSVEDAVKLVVSGRHCHAAGSQGAKTAAGKKGGKDIWQESWRQKSCEDSCQAKPATAKKSSAKKAAAKKASAKKSDGQEGCERHPDARNLTALSRSRTGSAADRPVSGQPAGRSGPAWRAPFRGPAAAEPDARQGRQWRIRERLTDAGQETRRGREVQDRVRQ